MTLSIRREAVGDLREHARFPSTYESMVIYDVSYTPAGVDLTERRLPAPYRKDYDRLESPLAWPQTFDTAHWVLLSAWLDGAHVGGAIGAARSPGTDMLESRDDLAVVWDLRVAPAARRRSVATTLLSASERWAIENGCRELKVETQNTNVAACKLYAGAGFVLSEANMNAYPQVPDEAQLIWRKRLDG